MTNNYFFPLPVLLVLMGISITLPFGQMPEAASPASIAGEYVAPGAGPVGVGEFFSGEWIPVTDIDGNSTACVAINNGVADATSKIAIDRSGSDCATEATKMDNIDSYSLGEDVTTQSADWVPWPGPGIIGGEVSNEQAASAPYSVKIEGGGSTSAGNLVDPLYNLGGESTGIWDVRFKIYIPEGGSGFYNIQNYEGVTIAQWNLEVSFETDGTLSEDVTGTYPQGEWFDIVNIIDIDNELGKLIVDGQSVHTYTYGPNWNLGALNFFPRTADEVFYVDDLVVRPIQINGGDCPEGSIICDGFEFYANGPLSDQSAAWAQWSSSPADDGLVTEELPYEGCKSLLISDEDPDNQILRLGDRTEGNYLLEWRQYVPDGSLGYYNFQKFQDNPGEELGAQFTFNADGTVTVDAGAAAAFTFDWTADTWQLFQHFVDVDNDLITLVVDSVEIGSWSLSHAAFATGGTRQLGGIDFFGNTDVDYYLDNVLFIELPAVPGNACGGADDLQFLFGQGQDNPVVSGAYDNSSYTTTGQDPDFGWDCFNEPDGTGTEPELNRTRWFTFVGDGETYLIETVICEQVMDTIENNNTQFALYSGGNCGDLTAVACNDDVDIANNDFRAGFEIDTEEGVTYYLMTDGFGGISQADGEFCIQVTQLAVTTVTFQVDATRLVENGELAADGIHLAGGFNDFTGEPMNEGANNIWTLTLDLQPGTYTYKFQNGPGGWETIDTSIGDDCTVGDYGDREVVVEDMEITTDLVCFGYCVTCDMVPSSVSGEALQSSVNIFPNPARDLLNVQIDLPEAADNLNVRLVNTFGQVVSEQYLGQLQSDNIELDLSKVPAGAYMIQVRDGKSQYTESVIVQK